MQKSTLIIASLLIVCVIATFATGSQLTREEKSLLNKIIERRVEKVLQKIERRRATYQEEADLVDDSLLTHFLGIVNKVGLQNTKQLIIAALKLVDKTKVKYIEQGDESYMQMSDETLAGYFFQILGQIGEDTFRAIFKIIDKFIDQTPPQASNKYKTQGDFSEMSDESLLGYFWDVVGQIGFDAAKKIFDAIVKIFGYDMPIPGQASDKYKKNREQADSAAILFDFKQMLIKTFPHMAKYINTHWDSSKNSMNFKEFYNLAFPQ